MTSYDAIVIGAGVNGLACAAFLQRAGLNVVVLEEMDRVGGVYATEELIPGFRFSAFPEVPMIAPATAAALEVSVPVMPPDPYDCFLSEDAFVPLHENGPRMRAALQTMSPDEADAFERFEETARGAARALSLCLTYPATRKQVRRAFRQTEVDGLFARTVDGSIAAWCEDSFGAPGLAAALAQRAVQFSVAGPRTPGTAYGFLHNSLGRLLGGAATWGLPDGGTGAIAQALAGAAQRAGAEIRREAAVERVILTGRRVSGVELATGEELAAPVVCSAADPHRTAGFLPRDSLPLDFAVDLSLLPAASATLIVHFALGGLPEFPTDSPIPVLSSAASIDHLEEACRAAGEGRMVDEPVCRMWIPSLVDPSLAPGGRHCMTVHVGYFPQPSGDGGGAGAERAADAAMSVLDARLPGLASLVEDRVILTPEEVERRYGTTGGHPYHGEILPDWLFDRRPATPWHRHRLPVPGLYLCGPGAHPGGGLVALPGLNAARAVLQDAAAQGVSPVAAR